MEMVKIEKSKNLPQRQYFEKINWVLLAMAQDKTRKNKCGIYFTVSIKTTGGSHG